MTWLAVFEIFLSLQLNFILAFLALKFVSMVAVAFSYRLPFRFELQLNYLLLVAVLISPSLRIIFPKEISFLPTAKVWLIKEAKPSIPGGPTRSPVESVRLETFGEKFEIQTGPIELIAFTFLGLLMIFLLVRMGRDLVRLQRIVRGSHVLRQIGKVRILLNDELAVPFSYRNLLWKYVVLPTNLIEKSQDLRISIFHEIQHHRQGDTKFVYLLFFIRHLFFMNPMVHQWHRKILALQEFSCDEAVVGRTSVNSRDYTSCLWRTAQTAIAQEEDLACATGFLFRREKALLIRRIEMLVKDNEIENVNGMVANANADANVKQTSIGLRKSNRQKNKLKLLGALLMTVPLLAGATYATQGLIEDRRISMLEAKQLAHSTSQQSGIPVEMNELVYAELKRFVGTPEGRDYLRKALVRLQDHRELVLATAEKYGVPAEIIALPVIESAYRNLKQGEVSSTNKSAGVWQFIPSTARIFGLRVDDQPNPQVDERLNIPMATDAALRYLMANQLRFKDWKLAILSYNMGESAVQKAIDRTGHRDAWDLIRKGHEGDRGYLAKYIAALIVYKNPELIRE